MTGTHPDQTETGPIETEAPTAAPTGDAAPEEPETLPREYVRKLRDEAAGHRVNAERAEALATRLVTAQATLTGELADATDLPFTRTCSTTDSSTTPRWRPPSTASSSASRTWPPVGRPARSGRVPGRRRRKSGSPRCCAEAPEQAQSPRD